MAVFTAIAGAIVGAIAGTAFTATLIGGIVVGVVAAGLAYGTAKLLGVFDPPDMGRDPGVKIQVAPSTDNKIGVAFGRNFMSGPITDVAITNSNDTMNYCITLSEYVEGATYTVRNIFWGDTRLVFNNANVVSYVDPNSTTNTDWVNKIRCRVYAGGTASTHQVFPTTAKVDATTMMRHWTNTTNYSMEDLVFIMIEVDYDAENGLTGLGAISVDLEVSVDNPGDVLQRYLNNTRWGAGLANAFIDTTSIIGTSNSAMKGYCDEQISYTNKANVSTTIDRFQTNGYINTNRPVLENIDRICRNANTYFTFDGKQGKFKTVPNRELSSSELANCFVLNDDNIVSKIGVQSTELYSLFNSVKIEFADQNRKDQTNTIVVETPGADRNPGEPDNQLEYRTELVNNNIHAETLANIDLNQSRNGMVVQLSGDYSTLQIDAGDVVKLTNSIYGFTDKLFRVMLNKEKLTPEGMITCELTLLEYNTDVYTQPAVTETPDEDEPPNTPPPINPPPITPPNDLSNFFFNVTQTSTTGSGTNATFIVRAEKTFPFPYANVFVLSGGTGYANADVITVTGNNLRGRTPEHDLTFQVAGVDGSGTIPQVLNATQNITGNANLRANTENFGGIIDKEQVAQYGAGGQVDTAPAANTNLTANNAVFANVAPAVPIDLANIENGKYTVLTNATPLGEMPGSGVADFGIRFGIDVDFANNETINNYVSNGQSYQNFNHIPSTLNSQGEFEVTDDMVAARVRLEGFNTLADIGGVSGTAGFTNMKYDSFRITKGEIE